MLEPPITTPCDGADPETADLPGAGTGTNWLTLGMGTVPQSITTDSRGTGQAALFRNLAAFPVGATFDIHFRVIDAGGAVVLESGCYQFVVTQ